MTFPKIAFFALFLLGGAVRGPAETALANVPQVLRDLPYVPGGGAAQRLDLYLPSQAGGLHPLLVWIHGGGWRAGSKANCPAAGAVAMGCVVASVEYRFAPQAVFPAQIEDCKTAIRWLRAHAAQYGIDPARVGVWGASAGGHLAALLGTTGQSHEFDVGENLDQSSAVQCVVDFYGPADFMPYGRPPVYNSGEAAEMVAGLLGGPVESHEAQARAASPVDHVTKTAAPFLIVQGASDRLVPPEQSEELDAVLRKAGVESTLKIVPGAGHGGPAFASAEITAAMTGFFQRHLQ